MTLIFLSIGTFVSTLIGGYFSIKNQDKLHRIMAFTAGVIEGISSTMGVWATSVLLASATAALIKSRRDTTTRFDMQQCTPQLNLLKPILQQ